MYSLRGIIDSLKLYVFILVMSGLTNSLKSTPQDRFLTNFSMAILLILRVFKERLLKGSRGRNILIIYRFAQDVWADV